MDIEKLVIFVVQHSFGKEELLKAINSYEIAGGKAAKKMRVAELKDVVVNAMTPEMAAELRTQYDTKFKFSYWDAKEFFDRVPSREQMEYLARHGRLTKVGSYCSYNSDYEYGLYSPESISQLTEEDFNCPARQDDITASAIVSQYGWTKRLIAKYLPEPAKTVPNPHYKSGPPMKLYYAGDVERIMESEEFQEELAQESTRSKAAKAAAKKGVATKKSKLMAEVREKIKEIKVTPVEDSELVDDTLAAKQSWYNYNASMRERYSYDDYRDAYSADAGTVRRWVVNYIRHNLTEYDENLYDMAGKVGCHEAYHVYRDAVLDVIASVYPKYAGECRRQKTA